MSVDARNFGSITGGIVDDLQLRGSDNNVLPLRIAVDYAGRDQDNPDNKTGYFRAVYFMNDDSPNARFIKDQVVKGNLKKGSQVQVLYRLQHERRTYEGQRREEVQLVVESMTYAASGSRREDSGEEATTANTATATAVPDEF